MIDGKVLEVQIADTKELRIRGLSWYPEKLPYNEGMLFVFDGSGTRSMWMLGMQFNLDIIWLDENSNVVAIEKNVPLCETAIEVMTMNQLDINVPVDDTITSAKLSGVLTMPNVLTVKSYVVASLPTAVAGGVIFVTDETGGAVLAFSDGTNWRRSTDRAVVS